MKLEFDNLHIDGHLKTTRDALLRVVGDLVLSVDDVALYQEVEFPLLELGVQLARWKTDGAVADFVFTSLDSDVDGLLRFEHQLDQSWLPSSPHQIAKSPRAVSKREVLLAIDSFLQRLSENLPPGIKIQEVPTVRRRPG